MTWLKKFGLTVLKVVGVVSGVAPLVQGFLPPAASSKFSDIFSRILQAVQTTEVVFAAINDPATKTGPDKLRAASLLVAQIVQSAEFMAGKKVTNAALFTAAITKITSGVADLMNALDPATVTVTATENITPALPEAPTGA